MLFPYPNVGFQRDSLLDWFLNDIFRGMAGVDKTQNMEHPGTFQNILEHPGTSQNIPEHEK